MTQKVNYSDSTPAADANNQLLKWKADAPSSDPTITRNISVETPLLTASGAGHQGGLVPDPGAAVGTTKFLREDASWAIPAGSGGGGGGSLFQHFADVGSVGTTETDLYSDSVVGGTLNVNGSVLFAKYAGSLVNSTSTKRVRVYFSGVGIFDSGVITTSGVAPFDVLIMIVRESSTIVRINAIGTFAGASIGQTTNYVRITGEDLTVANILKITGQAGGTGPANNDILAEAAVVWMVGAGGSSSGPLTFDSHPVTANTNDDEFDGTSLNAAWTVITNTIASVSFSTTIPGSIFVKFSGNQKYVIGKSFVPGSSDFSVTLKCSQFPATQFDSIMLQLGDTNVDGVDSPGTINAQGLSWVFGGPPLLQMNKWVTGTRTTSNLTAGVPSTQSLMYMHIQRVGGTWTMWYSTDGLCWRAATGLTLGTPTVSFVVISFNRYGATPAVNMSADYVRFNYLFL